MIITWELNPFLSRAHNQPCIWESGLVPSDLSTCLCTLGFCLSYWVQECTVPWYPCPLPSPSSCTVTPQTAWGALETPRSGESRASVRAGCALSKSEGLPVQNLVFTIAYFNHLSFLLSIFSFKTLLAIFLFVPTSIPTSYFYFPFFRIVKWIHVHYKLSGKWMKD